MAGQGTAAFRRRVSMHFACVAVACVALACAREEDSTADAGMGSQPIKQAEIKGKTMRLGMSLNEIKREIGEPQTMHSVRDSEELGAVATYYDGNFYDLCFDKSSPPKLRRIFIDGGY